MTNDITAKPKQTGLALPPDYVTRLLSGIAESRAGTTIVGGKPFLRMLKSGEWVYGQTNDEVQARSRWAVNIMTIQHGWICWPEEKGKNSPVGEAMANVLEPRPPCPPPVDGAPYREQRSFELSCIDGDAAGIEVVYKITSIGGLRAADGLLGAIHKQMREQSAFPCPVIHLEHDWYDHPSYGRIYTPMLPIVDWANLDGELASAASQPVAAKLPLKPVPKPVPVAPPPPPPPAAPLATAQLHTGQRRRPGVRS